MAWGRKVRRWLVGIGAVALPGTAAFGWWVWLPRAVEAKVVEVAARHGFEARVEGASGRFSSVGVDRIVLEDEHGLAFEVESLSVGGSPLSLALDGSAAIESIDAERVSATVDVARGGAGSVRNLRARASRANVGAAADGRTPSSDDHQANEAGRARPPIRVRRAELTLRDTEGSVRLAGQVSLEGQELRVQAGEVQLGSWLEAESIDARIRQDAGWKLVEASVGSAKWDSHAPRTAEMHLVRSFREPRAEGASVGDGDDEPPWSRWLDAHAAIGVDSFEISRETGTFGRLSGRVSRDDETLRLHGEGTVQDGSVRWNLQVRPDTLSGSGSVLIQEAPFDLLAPLLPELPWWHPELARVSADLTIEAPSPAEVQLRGRMSMRDVALESPRIAPHPVRGLSFEAEGNAHWHPDARRLVVDEAQVQVGAARAHVRGELVRAEHFAVDVRVTLEPSECNAVIHSIPADLLQEAAGFRWSGRLGGSMRLALDTSNLDETRLDLRIANGCRFDEVPIVADLRRFEGPFLHRVVEPDGAVFEMTAGPGSDNWIPIVEISPYFVHAVLAHEDAGFFQHSGFATHAIRDALVRNVREGRYVQGASTISMQLTKNLLLHREKTIARKLQEVLLTWWIESALDKEHILELYLNVIEYAPGVYGIVRGSEHYFGRSPADLSPAEAAFLACVLPGPKRYHEHYVHGSLSSSMRNRVRRFLEHMHARGRIDRVALDEGLAELEGFTFHRPGRTVSSRTSLGTTAPLPFERAFVDVPIEESESWSDFGPDEGAE